MWQYIIAVIVIAITARIITAVRYVKSVSCLNIMPNRHGLKFWFSGHLDDVLQGRPFSGARLYFIPYVMELIEKADMPAVFLPGPLIRQRALIYMNDPVAIRECFSSQHMADLHKGPEYNVARDLLGNGILAANEDVWHTQRRICDLGFVNSVIRSSVEKSAEVTNTAVEKLVKSKNADGKIIITADIEAVLIATDIMGHVVFGCNFDAVSNAEAPMYKNFKTVLQTYSNRVTKPELLPNKTYNKSLEYINTLVDSVVALEKSNPSNSGTLLSHLIESDYKGQKLTENEIKDNIKTFMFAGQDTTASAVGWTLYYLAAHPEIQKKAIEEVDRVLGRDRSKPVSERRYEMVKTDLVYINYIMKEILRLRPSAVFSKIAMKDITLPGVDGKSYPIRKGVVLFFNPMFIQMSKKYWGEDAAEFKPERWANLENAKDLSLIYFPFSQGHRSCIGASFAKAEFVTVVAKFLQSFELKLTPETEKSPPKVAMDLTMMPESYTLELVERK